MLQDGTGTGSHSYTWDAEGRMTSVSSPTGTVVATYTYNALGQRVYRSGSAIGQYPTFEYYDAFGNLALMGNNTTWNEALFPPVGGRLYGEYLYNTTHLHANPLGSSGATTTADGTFLDDEIYDPWGQRWALWNGVWAERFAGMQRRDGESGLDHTPNRMYNSQYGRWLSPDPLGGDISNPQSLNRYAYVLNNPTNLIDPDGLCPEGQICRSPIQAQGIDSGGLGCEVNGIATWCGVATAAIAAGAAYVNVPPPPGYIPVGRGDRGDCPGCYMDPNSDAIWDPQSEDEGWERNLAFLADFLNGTGPSDRYYGFNSPEMQDMMASQAAMQMREWNRKRGCSSVDNFNRTVGEAALQVFTDFQNYTQKQVGAFHAAITNHDGLATYTIINTASQTSFLLHATPNTWNHDSGLMRNIYQVFNWTEPRPCP